MRESKLPNYHLRVDGDLVHDVKNMPFDNSDETVCGSETQALFNRNVGRPPWHNFEITKAPVTCMLCVFEVT